MWTKIGATSIILVAVLFMVSVVAITISNEQNNIQEGVITDKRMTEGRTTFNKTHNNGYYEFIPAVYSFRISGEKDGKEVNYWTEVPYEDYVKYRVGDYYKK